MGRLSTLFFIASFLVLSGCKDLSCPLSSPLRSIKPNEIADLKKQAAEYESAPMKGDRTDRLGQIYYDLGMKYLDDSNWDQAIASFEKSMEYGKKSAAVRYNAAVSYANKGKELNRDEDIRRAEQYYRQAIEINPDYLDAHYGLAILIYYEKDDTATGTLMMERIVGRSRTYYRAHFALGKFYYEQGKPEKALAVYEGLYKELEAKGGDSGIIKEYREQCSDNIRRLMKELSGS